MFASTNQYSKHGIVYKLVHFHWILLLLVAAVVGIGLAMLFAVAGGDTEPWMRDQAIRFGIGVFGIFLIAFLPIALWRNLAILGYIFVLALLAYNVVAGQSGGGAERWINVAGFRLQPSEFAKLAVVLVIASYYSFINPKHVSNPLFMLPPILLAAIPAAMVLVQPDLGTALFILLVGAIMMFLAGVSIWYFVIGLLGSVGTLFLVFKSRGTDWQIIKDYQFERIDTFLNPESDPSGAGYQIIQSKIALGSGGLDGRGWLTGTQSQLNFLPENHTDFIFTSYAESFGYVGTLVLLGLFLAISLMISFAAFRNKDRFGALVTGGVGVVFFLFYMVNMSMVMGLAPVVGVPLPFVSYGGSALLMLCAAIGFVQNAHINKVRKIE